MLQRTDDSSAPGTWKLFGVLAACVVLSYATLFVFDAATITRLTDEDGFFESLGALVFFVASVFFFVAFLRSRHGEAATLRRLSLLGLAVVLFFCGGEEISWGQRVLGFQTPKLVADVNAQDEFTLHNLNVFQGRGTLPIGLNDCFQMLWIGLSLLIPIAAALSPRLRSLAERCVPVFPLTCGALFVLVWTVAKALGICFRATEASITTHSVVEIKECGYAFAFAGMAFWAMRSAATARATSPAASRDREAVLGSAQPALEDLSQSGIRTR